MTRLVCFLAVALSLSTTLARMQAATYYAGPAGNPAAAGSAADPWDLPTALAKPLAGGDVLYLLGGTYTGNFQITLNGAGSYITVTHAPDQWAKIDGSLSFAAGSSGWVKLDNIEIFSSNLDRTSGGTDCINAQGPNLLLVHNILHDCHGNGIGFWSNAANSVAHGNLIYYNGWNGSTRGHGHGMYIQSNTGHTKLVENNVVLAQFGWGLHAYTEGGRIDGITYRGNMLANNGSLASVPCTAGNNNMLTGGLQVAQSPVWESNDSFYPQNGCTSANLGYAMGTNNARLVNNWLVGSNPLQIVASPGLVESGNVTFNWEAGKGKRASPPALTCKVRPDAYETGRGIVAVFNLASKTATSVTCDVSALGIRDGQQLSVVSAEDYFGASILATVLRQRIVIPLTGWSVAAPIGWSVPPSTLPKFGVFVVTLK